MERVIKFRGLSLNGYWSYGQLCIIGKTAISEAEYYISNSAGKPMAYSVRPETIGQFTGLQDKNRNDIYEGHIFKWGSYTGQVVFKEGCFVFETNSNYSMTMRDHNTNEFEVIGNIYENPDLLK